LGSVKTYREPTGTIVFLELVKRARWVDLLRGGEPWLCKTTIRRRVMIRMFGEAVTNTIALATNANSRQTV
jgi:hypothetical protein